MPGSSRIGKARQAWHGAFRQCVAGLGQARQARQGWERLVSSRKFKAGMDVRGTAGRVSYRPGVEYQGRQGAARRGPDGHGKAGMAWRGLGTAWIGKAGVAGLGTDWRGREWLCKAGNAGRHTTPCVAAPNMAHIR